MKRFVRSICACVAAGFLALISCRLSDASVLAEEIVPADSGLEAAVYVTVADGNGSLLLAQEEVLLRDADGDGALTVQDALLCAHDARFEGGAAAGYASDRTEDGLSVTRLWGKETDGCGFYINHIAVSDLLSPVQPGDLLCAFVCAEERSNIYCYFDASQASIAGEEALTLTLTALESDEEGAPIASPVAGAVILIDGRDTAFSTNEEGKVTLQFDGSGTCLVSARKDGVSLIPPVCAVAVSAEEPAAGDHSTIRWIGLSVAAIAGLVLAARWRIRRTNPI